MRRTRLVVAATVAVCATALAGCSISTTSSTTVPVVEPVASSSPPPVLDLQLRVVESVGRAEPGSCPALPSLTPDPAATATLCSNDGRLSYGLEKAAVTGQRVTSIEALDSGGTPVIQIKLDAMGGTSLRSTTLRGSLADPQPGLAIVTHGGVLAAPTMTEELDGGVLLVSGFESLEKAQEVVDYITALDP